MTERADELMTEAQGGDVGAWFDLSQIICPRLIQWLTTYRSQSQQDAEDITQETLARMFEHLTDYTGKGVMTWAKTIALNLVRDAAKKAKCRPKQVHSTDEDFDLMDSFAGGERDPSAIAAELEQVELANAAIDGLSTDQGYVVLAYASGQSLPEIAEELGIPLPTVKSRLHHARKNATKQAVPNRLVDAMRLVYEEL